MPFSIFVESRTSLPMPIVIYRTERKRQNALRQPGKSREGGRTFLSSLTLALRPSSASSFCPSRLSAVRSAAYRSDGRLYMGSGDEDRDEEKRAVRFGSR